MSFQMSPASALHSVPPRKLAEALEYTVKSCLECSKNSNAKLDRNLCKTCQIKNVALMRYAEANIPAKYWDLEMDKSFQGDVILMEKYQEITKDLRDSYNKGIAYCFAGSHGLGKTYLCCNILKRAKEKGYSALYCNLNDIISVMVHGSSEDKFPIRKLLLTCDFLVIDEFDPRFYTNEKSAELFGKILEDVFRNRSQNGLPILMCTNSPNVIEGFSGAIKQSISSLMNCVTTIPVLGKDFRKEMKK